MTFRKWAKYRLYGLVGSLPYFGFRVHFPKGCIAFRSLCEQGIYEADNVRVLQQVCRPGSWMFDVGANLGLMALPILASVPDSTVVSFEPSPNALPWLRQTVAGSGLGDRWQLVDKAMAATAGPAGFSVSAPTEGLYDGLISTRRSIESRQVNVEVTTVDLEWNRLGCPPVSVIKIDVEGAELGVLRGGTECLTQTRPFVLLEWCSINLRAYDVPLDALLCFARDHRYLLYALPAIIPVTTAPGLELQLMRTESFLLAPQDCNAR